MRAERIRIEPVKIARLTPDDLIDRFLREGRRANELLATVFEEHTAASKPELVASGAGKKRKVEQP